MDWQTGDRVTVRGGDWKIAGIASFEDCAALDLCGERTTRTLLVPFDRPRFRPPPHLLVVSRRRSLQILLDAIRRAHPYGGLRACPPGIRLLAYQMEPALAVLRHGASRVLIADDVGLGKTVEAGLIIREIATADRLARSLVLCPASLRRQWTRELADRFELQAIDTDDGWMRRAVGRLPPDVNPWSLPGVYVASMDFVKRPEVLHPLEQVRWDLLVMDEAHAAAPGTNRRAAVHAIGCRASRVVLLTATPHSGRDDHFAALCRIGDPSGRSPIILFSRSRDAVSLGGPSVRSSVVALDLSPAEQTMHRLLDAYTTGIWNESRRSGNLNGELIATLLRKRALSSAAALEISLRRRLALLAGVAAPPSQLPLPLEAEDMPPDEEPEALLAAPGLSDRAVECHALGVIAESAAVAAVRETKLDKLLRFLSRARESAIVFSEYRDTAERLRERLAAAGHRVCVLHGGLTQAERDREMAAFAAGKSVMVATDAASEGLNLHHTCRLVVHFELPWTPSRLQQRCGRVNRIGQERRVHEIALVGRHTAEQLVLVPLLLRAARARSFSRSPLMDQLTESQVAAHVLGGTPVVPAAPHPSDEPAFTTIPGLADEARHEVERLDALRRLAVRRSRRPPRRCAPIIPISRPSRRRSRPGTLVVFVDIALRPPRGRLVERLPAAVAFRLERASWPSTAADLRRRVEAVLHDLEPRLDGVIGELIEARIAQLLPIWRRAQAAQRDRAAETRRRLEQAARQLVQAGLFDRRAMRSTRELLISEADCSSEPAAGWSDDRPSGEWPATDAEIAGRYQVGGIWLGALG